MRGAALLALALAGCAAPPVPRAEQEAPRPTIVSLNPCTDAILAEVAAPGQLLAISHYSKDAANSSMEAGVAARFAATGGTVEEVLALDPDVVVAGSFLAPATRAALEDMGVRVVTLGMAGTVAESEAQVRELAALTRQPAKGEALVARIEAALEAARPRDGRAISAVLWQAGGIVPGDSALVSDLLRRTGFSSHSAARGLGQADYLSLEQVAADPPELLLIAGTEVGQKHPLLGRIPGMAKAAFDPRLTFCGGPTIIRAARRLAEIRRATRLRPLILGLSKDVRAVPHSSFDKLRMSGEGEMLRMSGEGEMLRMSGEGERPNQSTGGGA